MIAAESSMKRRFAMALVGPVMALSSGVGWAAEPTDLDASDYLESQLWRHCNSPSACVVTRDACGRWVAVNQAARERFEAASRVIGRIASCPVPAAASAPAAACPAHRCELVPR